MVSHPASRESPASLRISSRTHRTFALNSKCHEPASCSMARFTDRLVVSGPGVKRSLSRAGGGFAGDCMDCFRMPGNKAGLGRTHGPASPSPPFLPEKEIPIILSSHSPAAGDERKPFIHPAGGINVTSLMQAIELVARANGDRHRIVGHAADR